MSSTPTAPPLHYPNQQTPYSNKPYLAKCMQTTYCLCMENLFHFGYHIHDRQVYLDLTWLKILKYLV